MKPLILRGLLGIAIGACAVPPVAIAETPGIQNRHRDESRIGTVKFAGDGRKLILLPVTVANKSFSAVIDTGTEITIYDKSLQPLLGPVIGVTPAQAWNAARYCELVRSPPLSLGDKKLESLSEFALCHDLSKPRSASKQDFHAIIGLDVLRRLVVQIDFHERILSVFNKLPQMDAEGIALSDHDGILEVSGTIGGHGQEQFLLDTGFTGTGTVKRETFESLTRKGILVSTRTTTTTTLFGSERQRLGTLSTPFLLGKLEEKSLALSEGELSVLGLGYLSRFVVTLDFEGRMMYLQRASQTPKLGRWKPKSKP